MKRKLSILSLILSILLVSCGANTTDKADNYEAPASSSYEETAADFETEQASEEETDENIDPNTSTANKDRKIERFYDYSIQTTQFDEDNEIITRLVDKNQGFIESSTINLDPVYKSEEKIKNLHAVLKIPKESSEKFKAELEKIGQIESASNRINDLTKSYTDINIRLKSKETELDKLNELVEKATSLEDVMAIQARILEVQAEIDQIKAAISDMDNRVTYDTYNIYLTEVYDYNNIANKNPNFLERLGQAFENSIHIFINFIQGILITIATLWPIILLIGIIGFVVVRKNKKKNLKNHEKKVKIEE